MTGRLARFADAVWYGGHPVARLLLPLSWLYCWLATLRRAAYVRGLFAVSRLSVPVIVVGNLTAGGSGKTPLVLWLSKRLRADGFRPGIICRGYGGRSTQWPRRVTAQDDPREVGDEAVLLAKRSACPVAAGPHRVASAQILLRDFACDIVLSDDGLQHYRLNRDVEIAVVDGTRRYGNAHCLPGGPLREPLSRLASVGFLVTKGEAQGREYAMTLSAVCAINLTDEARSRDINKFRAGAAVHAVAGIGNPGQFYDQLRAYGLSIVEHSFPDHYDYRPEDIRFSDELDVLMTEKDAVKCAAFAGEQHWYLPVEAQIDEQFYAALKTALQTQPAAPARNTQP